VNELITTTDAPASPGPLNLPPVRNLAERRLAMRLRGLTTAARPGMPMRISPIETRVEEVAQLLQARGLESVGLVDDQ
jgi:hypothetical protein